MDPETQEPTDDQTAAITICRAVFGRCRHVKKRQHITDRKLEPCLCGRLGILHYGASVANQLGSNPGVPANHSFGIKYVEAATKIHLLEIARILVPDPPQPFAMPKLLSICATERTQSNLYAIHFATTPLKASTVSAYQAIASRIV
jgi:hypothetical protein